jgi:anti-sigma regulatory factor (Ser/Thr protein kinase)/predicted N-acetyltransferase YhbS
MTMRATLELPADVAALPLAQGFGREWAAIAGFDDARAAAIVLACEEAFAGIVERAAPGGTEPLRITGELTPLALTVDFVDREAPPAPPDDASPALDPERLEAADLSGIGRLLIRAAADAALWETLGRDGNRLRLAFNRPQAEIAQRAGPGALERFDDDAPLAPPQEYCVRTAGEESDWFQISRTIYRAYGYTYPGEDMYFPDRVRELNVGRRLVSVLATTLSGEVVGHYALELGGLGQVSADASAIAETGMAVVDPAHRGRGLMERMRTLIESEARALGLKAVFGQPVTRHPYSQRVNERFGSRPCALSLAFVSDTARFKGIEAGGEPQRESCLMYFKPLVEPETRRIAPPPQHRAMLLETYAECGLPVEIDAARPPLAAHSRVSAHYIAALDLGMIRVETVGADIAGALRAARNELARQAGARVLYLTMRLGRPGCAEACDVAERLGFFYGGLAPYFDAGEDVLRMQCVDIALDTGRLAIASPFARRILAYVEADRARVERL